MLYVKKSLEQVKAELEKNAERAAALADAWRNVTIEKKKDGKEFAALGRAIHGASVRPYAYHNGNGEKTIFVFARYSNGGYTDDEIRTFGTLRDLPKDDPRRPASVGLYNTYELTPDELREKIAERVAMYTEHAANYRAALETIADDYNAYKAAIDAANAIQARRGERSATYYALYGVVD